MKTSHFRFAWSTMLLLAFFVVATPSFAFSAVEILGSDSVTGQPWGSIDGQSYRVYIYNSSKSLELLDTGLLTTPTDPSMHDTCSYSDPDCFGVAWTNSPDTSIDPGDTIYVYVTMTGTNGNPQTQIQSFNQPPLDLGTYTMNFNTGTGPTAVTLSSAATTAGFDMAASTAVYALILMAAASLFFLRARRREPIRA